MQPTITFIIPIQKRENLLIEEINTIFKFSEQYPGFCEIIIVGNGKQDTLIKIAWVALKLNKITHPHVRTKIIKYTTNQNIDLLIQTGINHALGEKIVIVTSNPEKINPSQIEKFNIFKKEIMIEKLFTDKTTMLKEFSTEISKNLSPFTRHNI
ncbi:glycosyltransferase [Candidatus Bathyarchaeota archaeon]|nr:glycosyltransferase [Candidatus Bathyarchaeota archaeon]